MIIASINGYEVRRLGTFSCVEDAHEVYGEQSEVVGFEDEEHFQMYCEVMESVRFFSQALLYSDNFPDQ